MNKEKIIISGAEMPTSIIAFDWEERMIDVYCIPEQLHLSA